MMQNFNVILKRRPGADKMPDVNNFEYKKCEMPLQQLQHGEVTVKNLYLSVDPAQRCQMNENTGAEYLNPWTIGGAVIGLTGVGQVIESQHPSYQNGDFIYGTLEWPWKKYFVINAEAKAKNYQKVNPLFNERPSLCLGVPTGLTSIIGVREVGQVKPGQLFVVSGAAGACGSLAGQIARCDGAKVVGICGSDEKCQWIKKDLGFTHAINYKKENVAERLKQTCSEGVDVYFDNVGGNISNCVIKMMKQNSIVVLCGQISQYNEDVPYPPPLAPDIQDIIVTNNISRNRYLVLNYQNLFEKYTELLVQMLLSGKIVYRETIMEGLEHAGEAFVSMMTGGNIGKQIVKV